MTKSITRKLTRAALLGSASLALMLSAAHAEQAVEFKIKSGSLVTALNEYARQSDQEILFSSDIVAGKEAKAVNGVYEPKEALELILADTGLVYAVDNGDTVLISDPTKEATAPRTFRVAQVDQESDRDVEEISGSASGPEDERDVIIVTGTNIRGQAEGASRVLTFDRDSIDRAGFSTVQELIQSLPQNFNGGATEDTELGAEGGTNESSGVGVNLRGLGADSTLVLFNGRRTAQGGGEGGDFVDISSLPLSAIERVEVLTDGASALYGSDAIAGVVNFILRDDYEGAETRIRYGTVTDGDLDEFLVGQTFGKKWNGGNILLSYEYYDRGNLASSDRDFTADSDLTPFGGTDFSDFFSNPGNIAGAVPAAIPSGQDGAALTPGDLLIGATNLQNTRAGLDLLKAQERHSLFVTGNQKLTDSLRLFGEFRYANREFGSDQGGEGLTLTVPSTNPFFVSPVPGAPSVDINYNLIDDLGPLRRDGDVETIGGAVGGTFDFLETWQAEVYGAYNKETTNSTTSNRSITPNLAEALGTDDPATTFDPRVDGFFNPFGHGSNSLQSVLEFIGSGFTNTEVEAALLTIYGKADGELFNVPGGAVKLALGFEYREESFELSFVNGFQDQTPFVDDFFATDVSRDVHAFFGEVFLPIFSERNAIPSVQRFDISVSGRYEEYSDFGSSSDPKIGVVWSPFADLVFRGTWGTSFKAPKLTSFSGLAVDLVSPVVFNPLTGGFVTAALRNGSNPDLSSEESESWTIGARFTPAALPRFGFDISYFNIQFDDRISEPGNPFTFLFDPAFFSAVITEDPDEGAVQAIIDGPAFLPLFGPPPPASTVTFILDGRINNISATKVSGLDLTASYGFETDFGDFDFQFNGNYILSFEEALISSAPLTDIVNTINNPTELRLRGSVNWKRDAFGATVFVNHAGSYRDNLSIPERMVDSYTTLDLTLRYDFSDVSDSYLFSDFEAQLTVSNLLDEDPPFANNPAGVGYDPENADPRGRFVALQLTKKW